MKIKDIVIDDNGRIYNLRDELNDEQKARYDKALAILNQHVTVVEPESKEPDGPGDT